MLAFGILAFLVASAIGIPDVEPLAYLLALAICIPDVSIWHIGISIGDVSHLQITFGSSLFACQMLAFGISFGINYLHIRC
jgi:hypothetical protein